MHQQNKTPLYLLIPGRHQLLTTFQFEYLASILKNGLGSLRDVNGHGLEVDAGIDAIIFAVTSANHSNTRRNPLPFYLRAISIEAFGNELGIPTYIYGIDDVGSLPNFASYTLKRIKHDSELQFDLTPQNTLVICSTAVLKMYQQLGFNILPAELEDPNTWTYQTEMPWDLVEYIAKSEDWRDDDFVKKKMHASSYKVWCKYNLGDKVHLLFRDQMISSDGDLTSTRDYSVYVRQMDDIAEMKYHDTAPFIQAGRIGDIGCAVGSWIKQAGKDERFRESDFYGIEISRHLYEICQQRKYNGEFSNPFVFFSQRNAVTGLAFEKASMNTIHTSSLTHEIESYGSRADLVQFIKNRYEELAPGGVWINRDVVGPLHKEKQVLLWLNQQDGSNDPTAIQFGDPRELSSHLESLSTYARFFWFSRDFRKQEGYQVKFDEEIIDGTTYIQLSLQDAAEYLSRKDYTDNWQSEMHETFCFWDFNDWKKQLRAAGFKIHPDSKSFTNPWIVENRWKGKAALFTLQEGKLVAEKYPVTTMFLIGIKTIG
jgi:SAM-dependent methyltransferase